MVVTLRALQQQRAQWRSQDKQVTWPQHGHIQCTYNTHLLEKLGHLCHKNVLKLYITLWDHLRPFLATNTILSLLPVWSLDVHMKAITHANNWSLTLAFHIIFTWALVNFTWAQAQLCPDVAITLENSTWMCIRNCFKVYLQPLFRQCLEQLVHGSSSF